MADRKQLYVVYPEQQSGNNVGECFNWFLPGDFSRDKGEAQSIKQMVDWMKTQHSIDDKRIFVTGMSAGAAMAVALMAVYPDVFAGGASMAGIPFGCANDVSSGQTCMGGADKAPKAWGDLVRAGFTGHAGAFPRVAIFQGTADPMVASSNLTELVEQWTNVHGTDQTPEVDDKINGHTHTVFKNDKGVALVSAFLLQGMGHGMAVNPGSGPQQGGQAGSFYYPVNLWSCYHAVTFWGL
jgi:poly(hydroxyalkanoate) depolymerase family esterase